MGSGDNLAMVFLRSQGDGFPEIHIRRVMDTGFNLVDKNQGIGICNDGNNDKHQLVQAIAREFDRQ